MRTANAELKEQLATAALEKEEAVTAASNLKTQLADLKAEKEKFESRAKELSEQINQAEAEILVRNIFRRAGTQCERSIDQRLAHRTRRSSWRRRIASLTSSRKSIRIFAMSLRTWRHSLSSTRLVANGVCVLCARALTAPFSLGYLGVVPVDAAEDGEEVQGCTGADQRRRGEDCGGAAAGNVCEHCCGWRQRT